MKTYKVELTEEFIKEAHEVACDEWKTKIKDLVPEAFKHQFEVGKWYKHNHGWLVCKTSDSDDYGFTSSGSWSNRMGIVLPEKWKLATDKEVEEALIKEAKKRGLVKSAEVFSLRGKRRLISTNRYLLGKNRLYADNGFITIFNNGKWAELIENNTEKRKRNYILQKIEEMENQLNELKKEL